MRSVFFKDQSKGGVNTGNAKCDTMENMAVGRMISLYDSGALSDYISELNG